MATPNSYELSGHAIQIGYTSSGIDGKPHLSYHDASQSQSFDGPDEIETIETAIGSVVSVTIFKTVDTGSTSFSVLIPRMNIAPGERASVHTEGITTIHRFSVIEKLNTGQLDQYTVTRLRGSANIVEF